MDVNVSGSTPLMTPAPGERTLRFVGDKLVFTLRHPGISPGQKNWRARLRTTIGRAAARRHEIICAHAGGSAAHGASWRDVPMQPVDGGWHLELPLAEPGFFKAKAYLLDENHWQHWPDGPDAGICVHPDFARTANTIYCAFTRLFGATKSLASTADLVLDTQLKSLEARGYATLPPSGTFRDLARQLPHIVNRLGCRILHLLPVHPTPVTYARFGRFGSPYAALDLTAVDPALVEFDKRTTGIDQFCELTRATHALGARVFIDIVINHTGWGSTLQENHPEFFLKKPDGEFASPGAWGTVWEDLVELEQHDVKLWDLIADSLLVWCRRGVDGFRCDAGYKVPVTAWQYIIARVQDEFPAAIFLLEGLGGSWDATEQLLTEGGMQWAYSELFQNYSGRDVAWYLDYATRQSERVGGYVHYSETHDNERLAQRGRGWSLLRNRLCALTSPSGGFGFTGGVEWLAAEKIRVHGNTGLNWDSPDNIIPELAALNRLISDHPCFFDGARLTRLSPSDAPVYALLRESAEGLDAVLVLVNTDAEKEQLLGLDDHSLQPPLADFQFELLGQPLPARTVQANRTSFTLPPGAAYCLAPAARPAGLSGDDYRRTRAQAAWALASLNQIIAAEATDLPDWRWLARQVERSPVEFLAATSEFAARAGQEDALPLTTLLAKTAAGKVFPRVNEWTLPDARRISLVPAGHWLLVRDTVPFRASLHTPGTADGPPALHVQSIAAGSGHIACFPPRQPHASLDAELRLERYATQTEAVAGTVRFLAAEPALTTPHPKPTDLVLLTNGIGGMARLCVDLGRVNSKYDCVLGANLNPTVPVDRHVFIKRLRAWVNADGFLSPLDFKNLAGFTAGPPAVWKFAASAGDGRTVAIQLSAEMLPEQNTTVLRFQRLAETPATGRPLPASAEVSLTVRFDLEDRNFHSETQRNGGADHHFTSNVHPLKDSATPGFKFMPALDRQLRVFADAGKYHPQAEWCEHIPHPVEQTRGQTGSGDAYSPGWFELPLTGKSPVTLVATAETDAAPAPPATSRKKPAAPSLAAELTRATGQFVVRRDDGKTVIAGYPWFLDWGRDSLICARGLTAAGLTAELKQLLLTFAKFEADGTLPNTIHGNDVSNRDTSDAPLWFAIVCEEFAATHRKTKSQTFFDTPVNDAGRTIREVLTSIGENYLKGTPNGIGADADSLLIWSPSHFTWMDTNYPAGTPREGYPVEIQVLWIRLLQLLEKISPKAERARWAGLAARATASFDQLFWLEDKGWFADVLLAPARVMARDAVPSDALRNNCLLAVSLGLVTGERARRCVLAAQQYLVVPGGLRSLAPLPVTTPLPVWRNGQLLNNPTAPYWPRYEGDEDTRRKPAYHNGTAWTWTFPTFCEALARAWDFSPAASAAARSYLGSVTGVLNSGCLGQIPELLDGDAPHTQRGCDAQAWGVTEALRVWKLLARS